MELKIQPLLTAGEIRERVEALARQISTDYAGRSLLLIAVLKGSLMFASDLMRSMAIPVTIDFIRARSYRQTSSQGRCDFLLLPEQPVAGRHVLLVEDIVDTGITARAIVDYLRAQTPASLAVCSLLDKPERRKTQLVPDYVGFVIDNEFVVGYGMDYEEEGRHLPDIHVLAEH